MEKQDIKWLFNLIETLYPSSKQQPYFFRRQVPSRPD